MVRSFVAILTLALWLMAGWNTSGAQAQPFEKNADVSLIAEREVAVSGETFFAAFAMELNEGWHVYWRNPGDAGLPPEVVSWQHGEALMGEFIWPAPHELPVIPGELMDYGYERELVLPFAIYVPEGARGSVRLAGTLGYLICKDICIPEEAAFDLEIPIAETSAINEAQGQRIADAIADAPAPAEGEQCFAPDGGDKWRLDLVAQRFATAPGYLRFFPYEQEITHAAEQPADWGPEGAQLKLTPGFDYTSQMPEQLEGIVVFGREGSLVRQAFEVSAGLCVEAAAVSGGGEAGSGGSAGLGVATGGELNLFVLAGWALLGGIILNLMPCVLPVLSMKVLGIVGAAANGDDAHMRSHGLWYTLGVLVMFLGLAGLFVSLRSAGEFLSVGFQLQSAMTVSALALVMFVIGLWLLGMFELGASMQGVGSDLAGRRGASGAFFTGLLAAIVGAPCIGPFLGVALGAVITEPAPIVFLVFGLVGLGLALPFLLISLVPGLHRFLPKPGAWMERLKQFFAFPMFLSALWLLSVLADLSGVDAVLATGLGAILIAFGIWVLGSATSRASVGALVFGAMAIVGGAFVGLQASATATDTGTLGPRANGYGALAEPVDWSEATVEAALADGRGVFVDFTASWCATCQLNKATTLGKPAIQQAFTDKDITFMIADFTRKDPEIASALQTHKRPGVPMYLYYAPGSRSPVVLPQLLSEALIMAQLDEIR